MKNNSSTNRGVVVSIKQGGLTDPCPFRKLD